MNSVARRLKSARRGRRERAERRPAEVVIVSFPKSGRTWLRVLLGRALCSAHGLPEEQLLDTLELSRRGGYPPTLFSHDGTSNTEARHWRRLVRDKREYAPKKVVFLRRDPRDIVVSCYFQASRRRELFAGTLSDFVRNPRHGIRKIATFYNIWYEQRATPRAFSLLSYEDLHAEPAKALRRTLEFMEVRDVPEDVIREAVEYARFENMQRLESSRRFDDRRMLPGRAGDEESRKVRKGRVGGYRDYLSAEDVAYCEGVLDELGCPLLDLPTG